MRVWMMVHLVCVPGRRGLNPAMQVGPEETGGAGCVQMGEELALGAGHTVQYAGLVPETRPETCMIILTNVTTNF